MKNYVLFLALLLSACSSDFWTVKRKAEPQSQPAAHQHSVPVEVQQPVRTDPVNPPQKKREHNIEED